MNIGRPTLSHNQQLSKTYITAKRQAPRQDHNIDMVKIVKSRYIQPRSVRLC